MILTEKSKNDRQVAAAQNLVKCCKQAGLVVDDVVLGALALEIVLFWLFAKAFR